MIKAVTDSAASAVLEHALHTASLRHSVISNNIANVNTPGFKKSEVPFDQHLEFAMNADKPVLTRTRPNHMAGKPSGDSPMVVTLSNYSLRSDGNNVDIDAEMAELAKNNIYYDAVAQQLSRYFSNIKSAINEGRR